MNKQRWSLMLLSFALIMVIGACSNAGGTDNSPAAANSEPVQTEATNNSSRKLQGWSPAFFVVRFPIYSFPRRRGETRKMSNYI
ncbi:hypothetical protein [Paenibacillus luteus]|uniref:hypothetical protein n=1 Tax=Paenibacillus luteus TaxID=2545753 RepID=UPI00114414BC|nr:hypothetical protein [Paenibacillus luteus]